MNSLNPSEAYDTAGLNQKFTGNPQVPLVIDLDGTLIKSDLLIETFLALLAARPADALASLLSLKNGRAAFKANLALYDLVDFGALPFHEDVLAFIRQEHEQGREIHLVTAANERLAEAVARTVGLFVASHGSDGVTNLSGDEKARFVCKTFGPQNFDYIGNSEHDIPAWRHARRKIVVDARPSVVRSVREFDPHVVVLSEITHHERRTSLIEAHRPHQWLKNILVFLPLLTSHTFDLGTVIMATLAFLALSLAASSAYILNDLVDLQHDRKHHTKRHRPIASGRVSLTDAALLCPLLALVSVAIALGLSPQFFGVLAIYYATTTAYSLYLKRILLLDVFVLSFLYCIRVFGGAFATSIPISPWLVPFCMFLFLTLAVIKRLAELVNTDKQHGRNQSQIGPPGRAYEINDIQALLSIAAASGFSATIVLALYITSDAVLVLYETPVVLWLLCPLLMFWNTRILLVTTRGQMNDDPVVFTLKDSTSYLIGAAVVAVLALGAGVL